MRYHCGLHVFRLLLCFPLLRNRSWVVFVSSLPGKAVKLRQVTFLALVGSAFDIEGFLFNLLFLKNLVLMSFLDELIDFTLVDLLVKSFDDREKALIGHIGGELF